MFRCPSKWSSSPRSSALGVTIWRNPACGTSRRRGPASGRLRHTVKVIGGAMIWSR